MPESPDPESWSDVDLKLLWAEQHLRQFESEVDRWMSSHPYSVTMRDDVLHGRHVRRLRIRALNYQLPLSLSDFIYSLRSSLDHLAWQLSILGSTYPTEREARHISFPIHEVADPKSFARQVKFMPIEAVEIIKDLQPYKRGAAFRDDPLWQLNKLSNIDKHRTLAMNGGHTLSLFVAPKPTSQIEVTNGTEFSWPLALKDRVVCEPYVAELVLGEPVETPGTPFNVRPSRVREIYRYVKETVVPRFAGFLKKR